MMYSEFYERTGKEVPYDEYLLIEESYYEFHGNKDEFCKSWLADYESGKWEVERTLRKRIQELNRLLIQEAETVRQYEHRNQELTEIVNEIANEKHQFVTMLKNYMGI